MTTHTITHGDRQRITFSVFGQERHLEFYPPQPEPFIILEALTRRLDVFAASAMNMPAGDQHPQQPAVVDRCAGLVLWLDIQRPDEPSAAGTIAKVLPLFLYLLGDAHHPDNTIRMAEWKSITAMNNALHDAI